MVRPSVRSMRSVLFVMVALAFPACGAPPETPPEPVVPPFGDNQLTPGEQQDGWQLLFDGQTLAQFRGFRLAEVPAGWSVDAGTIHFSRPSAGARADLITREQYQDFELALEWKVGPGGNSGIFFHVTEDAERTYYTGPEMQILDDERHPDGKKPETSAGSNYALHPPDPYPKRPVGEWNEVRIAVEGAKVQHYLNGVKVVEYELWRDDWRARVAASKFAAWPKYGQSRSGHIALQDHGDELWFRNLRIRRLGAPPL